MYTNLLIQIKNAQQAKKNTIKVPYSDMDFAVAEVLGKSQYVESVAKKGRLPKRIIEIKLKYAENGRGAINGIKFLSTPSRQLFGGYRDFRKVKQGYGIAVVSTPKGIMVSHEARKQKLGGQLLFEIW